MEEGREGRRKKMSEGLCKSESEGENKLFSLTRCLANCKYITQ